MRNCHGDGFLDCDTSQDVRLSGNNVGVGRYIWGIMWGVDTIPSNALLLSLPTVHAPT